MKAKIYGHEIEGTPEEVVQFKQLIDEKLAKSSKPNTYQYMQVYFSPTQYFTYPPSNPHKWNEITCSQDSHTYKLL